MAQTRTRTDRTTLTADPALQAFVVLRVAFTVVPILFGLDKFFDVLVEWPTYLWPGVTDVVPATAAQVMVVVGVVEIAAGVLVALRPRGGGYVVAAWLAVIIVNLLLLGGVADVALRDLGLLVGALALARLATAYPHTGVLGQASR